MKHNNGKLHWKTAMTHINEEKQSYNNENNNETKNGKRTIVQQTYKNHWTMKTNETHESNTKIKPNNEKQHWNTAMTHSNEKQQLYYNEKTMRHKVVKQSYNNHTTIVQQWKNN